MIEAPESTKKLAHGTTMSGSPVQKRLNSKGPGMNRRCNSAVERILRAKDVFTTLCLLFDVSRIDACVDAVSVAHECGATCC